MVWWYKWKRHVYILGCVWAMKVEKVEKEKDNGRKKKIEGIKFILQLPSTERASHFIPKPHEA